MVQLNETCLKIDKPNAEAMINGFWKDGKRIRQSIWLTTAGKTADFPKLLIWKERNQFKLSPVGKKMDIKNFAIPLKYIAELDDQYFIEDDMALWEKICNNGLFDIWDPEGGPCKRFAQAAKSRIPEFRIQLLRIYEIDHEFSTDDIDHVSDYIAKLKLPIPKVKKVKSVILDEDFGKLKNRLEYSVFHHLSRPHALSSLAKIQLTADTITPEDIELLESEENEFSEGRLITRLHKLRERNPQASKEKKKKVLEKTGALACEVCCFDFHATYGEFGRNFAECHHRTPLSELTESSTTKLEDLAIVCANCHRMLHKVRPWKTVEELKKIIKG